MENLIVILLVSLIGLVIFAIFRLQAGIQKTMESARREVEMSKNIISDHAVKTLDTVKVMGGALERMLKQQEEAQALGNSLKYLLQTPKLRGNYAEEILEDMLERVLPGLWRKQYAIEGSERVDAAVIYRDTVIPIDAKFPREIYERYLRAENEAEKKKNWKLYEDGLKIQINSIKSKYIKPHKGTADFALMFIPSESIYYETIAERNYLDDRSDIYEYARNNKVVPVSPNTFYAFLQVILMGIRNVEVMKSAKKLQKALVKIERNFRLFYQKYEEIGASIDKASNAYKTGDTHINRFKGNVDDIIKLDLPDTDSSGKTLTDN